MREFGQGYDICNPNDIFKSEEMISTLTIQITRVKSKNSLCNKKFV